MIEKIKNVECAMKKFLDLFKIKDQLSIVGAAKTNG